MAYEVEDFQKQVVERSKEVPVVVDFWASWCGPCMAFAPILEKAAAEAEGAWELIKVDTEKNPELTDRFGINSLPTLKLFKDGDVVAEESGAMNPGDLAKWIEPFLGEAEPADERIDQIRNFIGERDFASATKLLENVIKDQPGNEEMKFMRVQAAIAMQPESVAELVRELEGTAYQERSFYLKELADLVIQGGEGDFAKGLENLQKIQLPDAASCWIQVLKEDRNHEGAKAALKNLFLYLGREHAVTEEFQPQFSSILFS